jgi:hypothetical protein
MVFVITTLSIHPITSADQNRRTTNYYSACCNIFTGYFLQRATRLKRKCSHGYYDELVGLVHKRIKIPRKTTAATISIAGNNSFADLLFKVVMHNWYKAIPPIKISITHRSITSTS